MADIKPFSTRPLRPYVGSSQPISAFEEDDDDWQNNPYLKDADHRKLEALDEAMNYPEVFVNEPRDAVERGWPAPKQEGDYAVVDTLAAELGLRGAVAKDRAIAQQRERQSEATLKLKYPYQFPEQIAAPPVDPSTFLPPVEPVPEGPDLSTINLKYNPEPKKTEESFDKEEDMQYWNRLRYAIESVGKSIALPEKIAEKLEAPPPPVSFEEYWRNLFVQPDKDKEAEEEELRKEPIVIPGATGGTKGLHDTIISLINGEIIETPEEKRTKELEAKKGAAKRDWAVQEAGKKKKKPVTDFEIPMLRDCAFCGKAEGDGHEKHIACLRCNLAFYCSSSCRKDHWERVHSDWCMGDLDKAHAEAVGSYSYQQRGE